MTLLIAISYARDSEAYRSKLGLRRTNAFEAKPYDGRSPRKLMTHEGDGFRWTTYEISSSHRIPDSLPTSRAWAHHRSYRQPNTTLH